MAKSTVKVPGKKKAGGGTITIPGTKIKAPRSLVILAGGGVLAALFFMRGSEDDEDGGGVSGSILAEEIAQRFASERDAFSGAIEDINQQLFDIEQERLEGGILPEPDQPRPRRDRIPDAPSGTFEQPTTTLFPFVQLSEVEAPRDEISITTSDAQIRADLRRGAVHKLFNIPISPGLVELLEGEAGIEDAIHPTKVPNLFVVPGGGETERPSELLTSGKARAIINELKDSYSTVWIDAPPIIPVADTRNLVSVADMLLIVVKPLQTGRRALQHTCELLRASNAPPMHVVLNGIPPSVERQYGYPNRRYKEYSRTGGGPAERKS